MLFVDGSDGKSLGTVVGHDTKHDSSHCCTRCTRHKKSGLMYCDNSLVEQKLTSSETCISCNASANLELLDFGSSHE